mmetsp:Transcript_6175/g.12567  ORF Transcript_6175/g.12567 Transcript_6175/m.12567 type:complete len:117 (-) Transcript_6175:157-507(-)
MTAYLPAVVDAIPAGEASSEEVKVEATSDILVGASMVVQMAKFAANGEFDSYKDADIPFDEIDKAIKAIGVLLSQVPQDTLVIAQKERCRREINKARDYEEMREVANSPVCLAGGM